MTAAARGTSMNEYDADNIKLTHPIHWNASDEDMLFFQQIGLRWTQLDWGSEDPDVDTMRGFQERLGHYDIRIYSARHDAYRSLKIQLGQPGRDEDLDTYCRFIRALGALGIPVSVYDFHPGNTFTTRRVERRGYSAREFDLGDFRTKIEKVRFDREYSIEEMWDHFTYFLRAVLPVAEEADVVLAMHPDDPPLGRMNGVDKLIWHYDGYRRAEEIAGGSKHWGLLLCVGSWSEGGDRMGKDVFEMIRDFGGRGRIFQIHFRNVSSPLPHFEETFPDDGYLDMYQVMKALRQVGYSGSLLPDHIPQLAGEGSPRAGLAYCVAYLRALLRRANEEVG